MPPLTLRHNPMALDVITGNLRVHNNFPAVFSEADKQILDIKHWNQVHQFKIHCLHCIHQVSFCILCFLYKLVVYLFVSPNKNTFSNITVHLNVFGCTNLIGNYTTIYTEVIDSFTRANETGAKRWML